LLEEKCCKQSLQGVAVTECVETTSDFCRRRSKDRRMIESAADTSGTAKLNIVTQRNN